MTIFPGFHPDAAAVKFHDPPHQRQADAGALAARIQFVEQAENGFPEARLDAAAIVPHKKHGLARRLFRPDPDHGRAGVLPKLECILDEVLQYLLQPLRVAIDRRQVALHGDLRPALLDGAGEQFHHLIGELGHGNTHRRVDDAADARQFQQTVEQFPHLVRRQHHPLQIIRQPVSASRLGIRQQRAGKTLDRDERAWQLVRHGLSEPFEFLVLVLEFIFLPLAVGHVTRNDHQTASDAEAVAQQRAVHLGHELRAARAQHHEPLVAFEVAHKRLQQRLRHALPSLRRDEFNGMPAQFGVHVRQPEHFQILRRRETDPPLHVHHRDAVRRGVDQRTGTAPPPRVARPRPVCAR